MPCIFCEIVVAVLLCALSGCWSHPAIQSSSASQVSAPDTAARCVPVYPGLLNAAAKLPPLPEPQRAGNSVIVGYVADSSTGHGLSARVLLRPSEQRGLVRWQDSASTDSTAGFVFSSVKPGKYAYWAMAMNYQGARGSIDISSRAETLRVQLRRAGLCDIKLVSRSLERPGEATPFPRHEHSRRGQHILPSK